MHRLPVLHADLPVRSAAVQRRSAASCASATCAATAWRTARRRHACRRARTRRFASSWSTRARCSRTRRSMRSCPARRRRAITVPTTTYATQRSFPRNLLPADFYAVRPSEQHRPLVVMLVLTQLSVGAFCVDRAERAARRGCDGRHLALRARRGLRSRSACSRSCASMLHLGRPLYAFRAVLGLRTSWLSREILGFGVFAGLAVAHAALLWHTTAHAGGDVSALGGISPWLGGAVASSGLAACSARACCTTRRCAASGAFRAPASSSS